MKIIGNKFKDYFDYLVGIYGEDEKIILDRRSSELDQIHAYNPQFLTLYFCGIIYEGIRYAGQYYWCEDMLEIVKIEKGWHNVTTVTLPDGTTARYNKLEPYVDKKHTNIIQNCPIILNSYKYPNLSEIGFAGYASAEDVYQKLVTWLTPKDILVNVQSDKEKIVSHGFDAKISFRKRK